MREAAVLLLYTPSGQFLLTRRTATCPKWPLHWDLPGGYLNPGESAKQGVARELAEETGLHLPQAAFHPAFSYDEAVARVHVFEATILHEFVPCFADLEHDDYRWTTWDRLPENLVQPIEDFPVALRKVAQRSATRHATGWR